MAVKREKIHFASVDELLGAPVNKEGTEEIRVDQILPFENHPFKVIDDDRMEELVQSIEANGVLTPVLVRPDDEGTYEMISGHRRLHAAKRAGLSVIPAIVKEMTDDEATICMVDSNVQREEILPSEKAYAYKMRYDAMRRQGYRSDLSSSRYGTKKTASQDETRLRADEALAQQMGESRNQVQRFMRLTELTPDLLDYVDMKKIPLMTAVELSYFSIEQQDWIFEYIKENGMIKWDQVTALRREEDLETLTQEKLIEFFNGFRTPVLTQKKITIPERTLNKYFPKTMSVSDREKVILELLEKWKSEQEA